MLYLSSIPTPIFLAVVAVLLTFINPVCGVVFSVGAILYICNTMFGYVFPANRARQAASTQRRASE